MEISYWIWCKLSLSALKAQRITCLSIGGALTKGLLIAFPSNDVGHSYGKVREAWEVFFRAVQVLIQYMFDQSVTKHILSFG